MDLVNFLLPLLLLCLQIDDVRTCLHGVKLAINVTQEGILLHLDPEVLAMLLLLIADLGLLTEDLLLVLPDSGLVHDLHLLVVLAARLQLVFEFAAGQLDAGASVTVLQGLLLHIETRLR